jgi:hypothetical protein
MGRDGDDVIDEVMKQLGVVLGELDTEALRGAVEQGFREAWSAIDPDAATPEPSVRPDGKPNVVVLEGGKSDTPDDDDDLDDDGTAEGSEPTVQTEVSVQVVRSLDDGWIAADGDWQTVYVGAQPATYRLAATGGRLDVHVDDQLVATLRAGTTCDVQGSSVRVEGRGHGSYRRL